MGTFQLLSSEDVRDLATQDEYIQVVRDAYRQRGDGAPATPRNRIDSTDPPGFLSDYFAILPETGAMGGYTAVAGFSSEDAHLFVHLYDADSGFPLAILDGMEINPMKTAAVGAVAVDELAREDASNLAIIGCGPQARAQVRAASIVRTLEHVSVYCRTPADRESFARSLDEELEATVSAVESSEAAVSSADIVITATTSPEPVFDGAQLSPGTHVTAMGQYGADVHEIDVTTVARSKYVPDLRARTDADAGAYLATLAAGSIDADHVHAELGDIVARRAPGRRTEDEITVFDSGGTAIETIAASYLLYERAMEAGRGQSFTLTSATEAWGEIS